MFIATTDAAGRPVCAVMARTGGADSDPPPLVRAPDARRLIFAIDEPGNTTGGLDVLAHRLQDSRAANDIGIGLLFVDFARRARYRVNGSGRLASDIDVVGWPAAAMVVEFTVVQAYANCPARIVAPGLRLTNRLALEQPALAGPARSRPTNGLWPPSASAPCNRHLSASRDRPDSHHACP
ncbi:hypothetical protein ACFQ4K_24680 [Tistrella bauzanensis]